MGESSRHLHTLTQRQQQQTSRKISFIDNPKTPPCSCRHNTTTKTSLTDNSPATTKIQCQNKQTLIALYVLLDLQI